jgi:uroporphyrinogen decarboxylase
MRNDNRIKRKPKFERILKTLRCEEPDCVPVAELSIDRPIKEKFLGKPVHDVKTDVEFWHKAGYDYIYMRPNYEYPGMPPSVAAGTPIHRDAEISHEEAASSLDTWRQIASDADMEHYPWPDPDTIDYSNLKQAADCLPEGMGIISGVGGIFTRTWMLMGFENFCMALTERPDFIRKMFDTIGAIQRAVLHHVVTMKNVGAFWYGDDLAYTEGLMVSPETYRKYLLPWLEELFGIARKAGLPVVMHTDGDVRLLIDDLMGIGLNALHPIEPKAMDICQLKSKYRSRLCLIGNIDMAGSLGRGTPEQVREEVRERIRSLAKGGGYAVGSSNSVAYYVPIENYKAMLEATFEFGKYPLGL